MCENERWKFEKLRCSDLVVGCGVETWQSFITDITDLTDRTLGGTKDGSKGYNSHHSEYDKVYLL